MCILNIKACTMRVESFLLENSTFPWIDISKIKKKLKTRSKICKAHWDNTALKSSPKNHAKISSKISMEKILGKLSINHLKNPQV